MTTVRERPSALRRSVAALDERAAALTEEVYALGVVARDPRTPWHAKAVLALVVGYAASPVDPIPDAIPVVGLLDELVVLPLGAALALRLVPDEVVADARERAAEHSAGRLRWVGLALVVLFWGAVAYAGWRLLW